MMGWALVYQCTHCATACYYITLIVDLGSHAEDTVWQLFVTEKGLHVFPRRHFHALKQKQFRRI